VRGGEGVNFGAGQGNGRIVSVEVVMVRVGVKTGN
jgi:hypothetical protein